MRRIAEGLLKFTIFIILFLGDLFQLLNICYTLWDLHSSLKLFQIPRTSNNRSVHDLGSTFRNEPQAASDPFLRSCFSGWETINNSPILLYTVFFYRYIFSNPLMVHHQITHQPSPSCPDLFNQLWVLLHFLRSLVHPEWSIFKVKWGTQAMSLKMGRMAIRSY